MIQVVVVGGWSSVNEFSEALNTHLAIVQEKGGTDIKIHYHPTATTHVVYQSAVIEYSTIQDTV